MGSQSVKSSKYEYFLVVLSAIIVIIIMMGAIVWNSPNGVWIITLLFLGIAVLISYFIGMIKKKFPKSKIARFSIKILDKIKDFFSII